ncbi:hypothetical protein BH10CHL1_BH10CHL1_24280 [soil metagenome]
MNFDPSRRPPYFERRLDCWKIAVLLCLFILLLLGALFWPDSTWQIMTPTPNFVFF